MSKFKVGDVLIRNARSQFPWWTAGREYPVKHGQGGKSHLVDDGGDTIYIGTDQDAEWASENFDLKSDTSTKETNPKDACGIKKIPSSTISAVVKAEVGVAMLEGAMKYGRHNYRVTGVRASVYYDAVNRHMDAFWEGEVTDPDSGLPHISKAIAGLIVLRDAQLQGKFVDDRPPKSKSGWQSDLQPIIDGLFEKYPNPKPAHTEVT